MNNERNRSFDDVYAEYKSVEVRTAMIAQIGRPGQTYHVHHIDPEDLLRRTELAKLLIEKFSDKISDPAELFEISKEAEEQCICGHQIFIHGSLIPPIDSSSKYTHDGPCLIGKCGCKKYKMAKEE